MEKTEAGYRVGWSECVGCGYRWCAILEPGCGGDWLECPECDEHGRIVQYIDPPSAVELRDVWSPEGRDSYLRAAAADAVKYGYEVF